MTARSGESAGGSAGRGWSRARALALPLAAALGLIGQYLLSSRSLGLYGGVLAGALLYAAAVTLLLLGLRGPRAGGSGADGAAAPSPVASREAFRLLPPAVEWTIVAILLLGGLYLRLYRIDLIPRGLNNDEAINALEMQDILAGRPFRTVTERGLNRETMFHYLGALSFQRPGLGLNLLRAMPAVFGAGREWIDDPLMDLVFPLRFVSIVAGVLTILALYLFGRDRFGWRVGLLAALFLAVPPWHLLYSRVGLRAILAPLFAVATVGLFLRALETGKIWQHVAWGVALGLGLWSYTSMRAVPLAMLAFLLLSRWLKTDGSAPPIARRPLLAGAGVAALLVITNMALSGLGMIGFLARGAYATLPPATSPFANLLASLTMINRFLPRFAVIQSDAFISDGVSTVYGLIGLEPETMVLGALATLGLVFAAWRAIAQPRDRTCAMLVLAVLALLLTVGLTGPSLTRMIVNLPWLCLLASLFTWAVFDAIAALRRPVTPWVAAALVAGLAGLGCVQGVNHYFLQAGRSADAMKNFGPSQTVMGMFVRSMVGPAPAGAPSQERLIYVLHTRMVDSLTYLIGRHPNVRLMSNPSREDLDALTGAPRTTTFIVEFDRIYAEPLRYLIMRFPLAEATKVADRRVDPDQEIFYTFTIWKDAGGNPIPAPPESPEGFPGPIPGSAPPASPGMSFPEPGPPPR